MSTGSTASPTTGWYFASDRMRVKHDNDYINDDGYEDRLAESAEQVVVAEACA